MLTCTTPYNPLAVAHHPTNIVLSTLQPSDRNEGEVEKLAKRITELDLAFKAARAMEAIEPPGQDPVQFVRDLFYFNGEEGERYPEWDILVDRFIEIHALPGSAHAFRALLVNVQVSRVETISYWTKVMMPAASFLETKLYGMVRFLADRARFEFDEYLQLGEAVEDAKHELVKTQKARNPKAIDAARGRLEDCKAAYRAAIRPADTYRAYGLALRYAVEELGSLAARPVLGELMLATPLPVDELENPDWIDPYTGERDGSYSFLRVKDPGKVDLSSGSSPDRFPAPESDANGRTYGNLPSMVQDLLDNMGEEQASEFQTMLEIRGSSLDDYFRQFMEAQRHGYVEMLEPEEEWEEPEFDVIESAHGSTPDLMVSELADKVKELMVLSTGFGDLDLMKGMKAAVADGIAYSHKHYGEAFDASFQTHYAAYSKGRNRDTNAAGLARYQARQDASNAMHLHFLSDPRVKAYLRRVQELVWKYPIPDVFTVILPFQNAYGLWEDDLYQIKAGDGFRTLAHWFSIHGDEYLEQFLARADVDYGDPAVNKKVGSRFIPQTEPSLQDLDAFTWDLVREQSDLYNDTAKLRKEWAENGSWNSLSVYLQSPGMRFFRFFLEEENIQPRRVFSFRYKENAVWTAPYIFAEVQAAVIGSSKPQAVQAAGWNSWRDSIDPEAAREYNRLKASGWKHAPAMEVFWDIVKKNANRIAALIKDNGGLVLRSGRRITWSVAILKLKANEIPCDLPELIRLRSVLKEKGFGAPLVAYLDGHIEKMSMDYALTSFQMDR